MFSNMKLGTKLIVAFLAVGLIPFAVIGGISLKKSGDALSGQAFNQLEAVREIKKKQIETFLQSVRAIWAFLWKRWGP